MNRGMDMTSQTSPACPQMDMATLQVEPDYYPSHEALHDLVSLQSEHHALNGGGPNWQARWDAALLRAEDIVRVEP